MTPVKATIEIPAGQEAIIVFVSKALLNAEDTSAVRKLVVQQAGRTFDKLMEKYG